jgi:hypothetical protein
MLAFQIKILYYLIGGLLVMQTIYLISRRPYLSSLSNFSIIFNSLFALFGLFWVATKNSTFDTHEIALLVVYIFIGLGYIVNLLGVTRAILILKGRFYNRENSQPDKDANKALESPKAIQIDSIRFNPQQ